VRPIGAGIVPATAEHVDAAWSIIDRCRAALAATGVAQWDDVYPTRDVVAADVMAGRLFVLVEQGICLATVALDENASPEYDTVQWRFAAPAIVVHRLCVDPSAQGRRLGHAMMDFAERHAAREGYASVRLDAYSPNSRSVSMYRTRGYREAGTVFFPRRPHPFYCFELALPGRP
jgi:ribosomal protein S18 acetylase RimI-like enzyme